MTNKIYYGIKGEYRHPDSGLWDSFAELIENEEEFEEWKDLENYRNLELIKLKELED